MNLIWALDAVYTLDNPEFQMLYIANAESTIYNKDGEELIKERF